MATLEAEIVPHDQIPASLQLFKLDKLNKRVESGEWYEQFLVSLQASGNIRTSCDLAGISRQTAYWHRNQYPDFAEAWDTALEDSIDSLEGIATERAKSKSDLLMIFMLKALRPDKYRENIKVESETSLSPDLADRFISELVERVMQKRLESKTSEE